MAQEIQLTIGGTVKNPSAGGGFTFTIPTATFKFNQSAIGCEAPVFAVPITDTAFAVGGITTPGWLYMLNLDATNYVQYGPTNAGAILVFGRLLPGEFALLRMDPGAVLRMKANSAIVNVQMALFQN